MRKLLCKIGWHNWKYLRVQLVYIRIYQEMRILETICIDADCRICGKQYRDTDEVYGELLGFSDEEWDIARGIWPEKSGIQSINFGTYIHRMKMLYGREL